MHVHLCARTALQCNDQAPTGYSSSPNYLYPSAEKAAPQASDEQRSDSSGGSENFPRTRY
jgi:hypothetical protein